jgi:hypothetical protein
MVGEAERNHDEDLFFLIKTDPALDSLRDKAAFQGGTRS